MSFLLNLLYHKCESEWCTVISKIMEKIKLIIAWAAIFILISIVYLISFNVAEPKAYDFMTKNVLIQKLPFDTHKNIYGHDDVVLVVIDTKSVEQYRWPWKRELYCGLLNYLSKFAGAKVVIYDSIINTLDHDNPQSDIKYFNCLKTVDNFVTGFMFTMYEWDNAEAGEKYDKKFKEKFSLDADDQKTYAFKERYESLLVFPKPYFDVIKNVGSINTVLGPINDIKIGSVNLSFYDDPIARSSNHIIKYDGAYYPSLSMRTYMYYYNLSKVILTDDEIIFPETGKKIKQKRNFFYSNIVPLKFYKLYKEYSHKNYSAIDVIRSNELIMQGKKPILDPELFRDKVVVIGGNVPAGDGLNDNLNSSISEHHPGMDIQATAIDNLIHHDFLEIIPQWANLLITIFGMLLLYLSVKGLKLVKSIVAIILINLGYIFICCACFYFDVVINVITPIVMFVISTIFAYTHKYFIENKNKEKVQNAMGKYMSKDVMKRVIENIDNLGLGGKRAVVTVLFSDIRGFTTISEKLTAQQVSEILNEYFSEMEPIITKYNGIINKFIGDAIMAVFGEPIQDANHAENAVKCAYEMLQKVKFLHKKWVNEGKPEIEIGIGINTGEVFVGNIGSSNRMEYTVIGDTVNLASRLESYNKVYKTKILTSETTYKYVKKIADVIKIPEVQIRGKVNKIDIYEILKVKID